MDSFLRSAVRCLLRLFSQTADVAFSHGAPGRADRRDPVSHPLSRGADRRHRPSDRPADRQYPHVNLHRDRPHRCGDLRIGQQAQTDSALSGRALHGDDLPRFSRRRVLHQQVLSCEGIQKRVRHHDHTLCAGKKITHAKELLRYSNSSIEEIARLCGMDDASYFNKVFKKMEGCTASEYRKQW